MPDSRSTSTAWDGIYWRALVEASPDVVLVVDATGTILFVNRVLPVFVDRGVVGRKLWEFAVGDAVERLTGKLREVISSRKAVVYENPGFRGDGSPGWYEVRAIPVVVDGHVERILWASSDISARKNLEAQVRQSQKMEAIGQLAGGVAHDFNNLLAVIMGFGQLAAGSVPAGHPATEQLVEVLHAARRGSELTRKLLALSRKQMIQPRDLDLRAAVGDFARVMKRILGDDVELFVDDAPAPASVHADPAQLEQVLMNLWTNSRQAMPNGGELHLSIRSVDLDAEFVTRNPWARVGSFAEVRVRDTGSGMDEATLARIFEPFFTTKDEGTGLGLSIVYGIVQQHGGFLHVESARGAGTTVQCFLPRVVETTEPVSPKRGSFAPEALRGSEVILLAEDEPSLRALFVRTLSDLGYRVIAVGDGEQAVREFECHAPEIALAVLDVVMPRLGARQVYERIRAIRADIRVLLMTGYAPSSAGLDELLATDDVPLLEKPFTPLALAASVRRAIDASREAHGPVRP